MSIELSVLKPPREPMRKLFEVCDDRVTVKENRCHALVAVITVKTELLLFVK